MIEPLKRPEIALPNELGDWVLCATDRLNEVIAEVNYKSELKARVRNLFGDPPRPDEYREAIADVLKLIEGEA